MDDATDEDTVSGILPSIGKSNSAGNTSGQRGTMAALFDDIITEEELLMSVTPKSDRHCLSYSKDTTLLTSKTAPENNLNEKQDVKSEFRYPIPPESPLPSKSFERSRNYSMEKDEESQTVSSISQLTASLVIDVGVSKLKSVSDLSQLTARSALNIGLAKRLSDDFSNDYDIYKPGKVENLLAATVTSIALENALRKTASMTP